MASLDFSRPTRFPVETQFVPTQALEHARKPYINKSWKIPTKSLEIQHKSNMYSFSIMNLITASHGS
jgi:hypothetical protein